MPSGYSAAFDVKLKGDCTVCDRRYRLTKGGTVRRHYEVGKVPGRWAPACAGSYLAPKQPPAEAPW